MSFRCCMSAFQRKFALALKGMSDISCHIYSEDTRRHSGTQFRNEGSITNGQKYLQNDFFSVIFCFFITDKMICVYLHTSKESSSLLASTEYPIPMDYTDNSFTLKRNNMKKKNVIKFVACLVDCDCVIPFQGVSGC